VSHLDELSPQLLAQPGRALRHDIDDPRLASPRYAPLREHLERFAVRRSLCLALPSADARFCTVVILVRRKLAPRTSGFDLQALEAAMPPPAEAYAACRALALLQGSHPVTEQACVARIHQQGGYIQTTPGFSELMWAGAAPQDMHVDPAVLRRLVRGQPWPLPDGRHTLYAVPDGASWLLLLRKTGPQDALSPRQLDIGQRFARGDNCQPIAHALGLVPATVRNHLCHICDKLNVRHRAGLIAALGRD